MRSKQPTNRAYLALAVPNVLTNLTAPIAGLVDLALLGHLDQVEALGGVALGTVIFDFLYWSFGFLRMSTTALIAKALGLKSGDQTRLVLVRSLLMAVCVGASILLFHQLIGDLGFAALQGNKALEDAGRSYFFARIWGAPAALCGYVVHGYLLGRQRSVAALAFAGCLNGVNIILDVILIGTLRMGPRGAGLATMIAEWSALGFGLWLVSRDIPRVRNWHWRRVFKRDEFMALFGLQGNIMIRTFCLIASFAVFTNVSARFGTLTLTANAILMKLLGVASYFIDGYAFALESFAGAFAGSGRIKALRRALRLSFFWNGMTVGLFILGFTVWGGILIGTLTQHDEVIAETMRWIPMLDLVLIFSGFAYILDGLFIGLAHGRTLRDSMVASTLVGFLPLAAAAWIQRSPLILWIGMISFMAWRSVTLGRRAIRLFRSPRLIVRSGV